MTDLHDVQELRDALEVMMGEMLTPPTPDLDCCVMRIVCLSEKGIL